MLLLKWFSQTSFYESPASEQQEAHEPAKKPHLINAIHACMAAVEGNKLLLFFMGKQIELLFKHISHIPEQRVIKIEILRKNK